ncbi:MAG: DNA-binding protein, partial [Prevotellaceae bacterium]|nr:DNA-binding protein [Prevotellaceae bacterium]
MNRYLYLLFTPVLLCLAACGGQRTDGEADLEESFAHPPEAAKPWVFWYWMNAAVSREGITADLEAMQQAGLGGAYLMPIRGAQIPPLVDPPAEQLSPLWWELLRHAVREADRLGLKLAMHGCDGFALAGGPWITPELSMQKVVWTATTVEGGATLCDTLARPECYEGYYRDIAVYAFPTPAGAEYSTATRVPKITSSLPEVNLQFLVSEEKEGQEMLRCNDSCRIVYEFAQPFTCRAITVGAKGNSYQAQRLLVEASDDGVAFRPLGRLQPPRHGWQNTDADVTHSLPAATARYFRFTFDRRGSEPGSEDLDAAKWKPSLKLHRLRLSGAAAIHQHEGKAAYAWRTGKATTRRQAPDSLCIPLDKLLNISGYFKKGQLRWKAPAGSRWTILRMGHTSTGHTNATGGGGIGLECDKLNPKAIQLQFDSWFGEIIRQVGREAAARTLTGFHVDSWECGSQNWSPVLRKEFRQRRGYDPLPYLPAVAGIPVGSADLAERFLYDLRQTIAELVVDNFYGTMQRKAHQAGCTFSAECVAPTMMSDGMAHYRNTDMPMGEFWLGSPTHDKPNDMLDAVSGAHIYGKNVVQAEAFTQLRMRWNEHPAMLKALGDRAYATGANRLVYHVFAHNPFTDRQPGVTLSGIGLFFQRDQTWWKPGRAWVGYAQRCQALLQHGRPVADLAVFAGDELPARALLPERLASSLPGIVGQDMLERELQRMANVGEPTREAPAGVLGAANIADPERYVDMLRGYHYDSFNRDALLRLAKVKEGRITLPGGASYALLALPTGNPLAPNPSRMSAEVA